MSCECLDRIDGVLSKLGDNTKLKRAFWLGSAIGMTASITTEKVEPKRGKPTPIKPAFCPFCGVKYEQQAAT